MSKQKANIAILGATGVVGREITKIVDELKIDFNSIKFLSSAKSAGTKIEFQGKTYTVEEAKPESFDGVNIVLASAGGSTSQNLLQKLLSVAEFWLITLLHLEWIKMYHWLLHT